MVAYRVDYGRYFQGNQTFITRLDPRLALVSELARSVPSSRVLDVGCGGGFLLDHLATVLDSQLFGIDVHDLKDREWPYVAADITLSLPFMSEAVNLAICGEVIEHVPDPDHLLDELFRVLSPSGHLVLTTPNLACWANRVLLPLGIQPLFTEASSRANLGRRLKVLGQGGKVQGHLRLMTKRSLEELVLRAGFRIERTAGVPFFFPPPLSVVDRAMTRFPSFASGLVILASKPA